MEAWKGEALRKIDIAAEKMKCAILSTPDSAYNRVYGEIDIWLCRDEGGSSTSVKIYQEI